MYTGEFYYSTLILYIVVSILGMLFISSALKVSEQHGFCEKRNLYYVCFTALFVLFASLRKIGVNLGGADMHRYLKDFSDAKSALEFDSLFFLDEGLFVALTYIIRLMTSNERIYIVICYSIITLSYVVFIRKYIKSNASGIPFILLTFLYLRSFNTLRTSLAIAVFLFGLTIIEKYRVMSIVIIISSAFIHRISIVFSLIIPFYYLYRYKIKKMSKLKTIVFSVFFLTISIMGAYYIQSIINHFSFLSSTDLWYVASARNSSLLSRWPMYITQLLLLIFLILFGNDLDKTDENDMIKVFCFFDLFMIPAAVIMGIWRASEYLYVARLVMWSNLIPVVAKRFRQKNIVKLIFFVAFMAWYVFRIYSEWYDLKIMPYVFLFE